MGYLETLEEKLTLALPHIMAVRDIQNDLFPYLRDRDFVIESDVTYKRRYEIKDGVASDKTEYPTKMRVKIQRRDSAAMYFNPKIKDGLCKEFKFEGIKGYDTIESFEGFTSGRERLSLIDDVKREIGEYFSSEPRKDN